MFDQIHEQVRSITGPLDIDDVPLDLGPLLVERLQIRREFDPSIRTHSLVDPDLIDDVNDLPRGLPLRHDLLHRGQPREEPVHPRWIPLRVEHPGQNF